MEESPGISASIINALKLTGRVSSLGYSYISNINRVPKDVRELLDELSSLAKILDTLLDYADANLGSLGLQKLNGQDSQLSRCIRDLEELLSRLEAKDISETIQWPLGAEEIAQYTLQIIRHKALFSYVLTADEVSLLNDIEGYTKIINLTVRGTVAVDDGEVGAADTSQSAKRDMAVVSEAGSDTQPEPMAQGLCTEEEIAGQEAAKRKKALGWLYMDAFDTRHIEISDARQKNTGEWFLKSPEVREWVKKNPNSPILWGYGIAGAGKTFLCSLIIDHLQDEAPAANFGVAYIYFDHNEQDRQKPRDIFASLVKQLVSQLRQPLDIVKDLLGVLKPPRAREVSLAELYSFLMSISSAFDQVFFIFDALDECDQKEQRDQLLPLFHRMVKGGIQMFITSRHDPEDIQASLRESAKIELSANREDIKCYIEWKINEDPRAQRLVNQGKCQDKIISELTDCAKGVFLLVRFHVGFLCEQPTTRRIMHELEHIKNSSSGEKPLDIIYGRTMKKIRAQANGCAELAMKIFSWLVKAQRTLSVDELREAVSVEPNLYELDEWDLPDKATLLDVCGGLVTIDEKSNTIRLVHYTAQEYLLQNARITPDMTTNIAITCITYLSFDVFAEPTPYNPKDECEHNSADRYPAIYYRICQHPFLYYASHYLSFHLSECDETFSTGPLLRLFTHAKNISSFVQASVYHYPLAWAYGKSEEATPLHLASFLKHKALVQLLLSSGANTEARNIYGHTPLHMARDDSVARLLLDGGADIEARDKGGAQALLLAAAMGSETVVKLLLDRGADIESLDRSSGYTAVHFAVARGKEAVTRLLLDRGANIRARTNFGQSVLHLAVGVGEEVVFQLLLNRGADIEAWSEKIARVLHCAASVGNEVVVQLLLDRGADIEAQDCGGLRALHMAAIKGRVAVIRVLLDNGANIEAEKGGMTALHWATLMGEEVVRLLLEKGANIKARNNERSTALHIAARAGREAVIQLLLNWGADIEAEDWNGDTALQCAIKAGKEAVVKLLIDKGADIEAKDESGHTALHWAILTEKGTIFQHLLDKGANIEVCDNDGDTILHCAARSGKEYFVGLLLDRGCDIEARNNNGSTVLHRAVELGQESVIRLLLNKGANIEARDNDGLTALQVAVKADNEIVIRLLIDRGADIEAQKGNGEGEPTQSFRLRWDDGHDFVVRIEDDMTALHLAALEGKTTAVGVLLEKGANIEAYGKEGSRALHLAAETGKEAVVQLLLDKGAKIEAWNGDRMRALHLAADAGFEGIVQLLLDRDADIEARDNDGLAPLHMAALRGKKKVVQLLLRGGANPDSRNNDGSTALQVAAKAGEKDIVRLLLGKKMQVEARGKSKFQDLGPAYSA